MVPAQSRGRVENDFSRSLRRSLTMRRPSIVDGLAACSGWLRADLRSQLDDLFDRSGVPLEVRERAFADRHNLMERA